MERYIAVRLRRAIGSTNAERLDGLGFRVETLPRIGEKVVHRIGADVIVGVVVDVTHFLDSRTVELVVK